MADETTAPEAEGGAAMEDERADEDEEDAHRLKKDVTSILPSFVEQDGGPPAPAPPPYKELQQMEVELRLLEALEIYHPSKLLGMHRHFVLYGLMDNLHRRLSNQFTAEEILELLDKFYNLKLLKPDEEETELLSHEEEFSLPPSILSVKEETKGS